MGVRFYPFVKTPHLFYTRDMSAQPPSATTNDGGNAGRPSSSNLNFSWRHSLGESLALSAAAITAYVWLSFPAFAQYSLQVFALCILFYFILKKANDAAIWQVLPTTAVDEMTLVTFAFFILIGATGSTTSVFFFLIFVYLFFVSMTMQFWTAIVITLETLLFFYAHSPNISNNLNLSHLISIPVVMTFFLFAKYQYEQAREKQTLIEIESNEINNYQIFLEQKDSQLKLTEGKMVDWLRYFYSFLFGFFRPKLEQLIEMVEFPQNSKTIKGQLTLINLELEKIKNSLQQSGVIPKQYSQTKQETANNDQQNNHSSATSNTSQQG